MADNTDNPFGDANDPFGDSGATPVAGAGPRTEPLSLKERFVIQNIFDTQPKRRAEYLKRIGFDMDPKDDNKIRPTGETGKFTTEIDPGGVGNVYQYMKKGGFNELLSDVGDSAYDFASQILTEAGADVAAGAAGAASAIPTLGTASIPTATVARSATRATGFNIFEKLKDKIGNYYLDQSIPIGKNDIYAKGEDIPVDYAARMLQSTVQAVGPELLLKGGKGAVNAAKSILGAGVGGLKNLLKFGGGNVSDEAMSALARDVETFGNVKNLKNASEHLQGTLDEITGANPSVKNLPQEINGGLIGKRMSTLEQAKQAEISKLSGIKKADVTLEEFMTPIDNKIHTLNDLGSKRTDIEDQALEWLKTKRDRFMSDYAPKKMVSGVETQTHPGTVKLPFREAEDMMHSLQKNLNNQDIPWKEVIRDVVDGNPERNQIGINNFLKAKATENGSSYAPLKEAQSKLFQVYNDFPSVINKGNVLGVVIGGDAKGTASDATSRAMGNTVQALDQAFAGSDELLKQSGYQLPFDDVTPNFTEKIQTGQLQNELYKALQSGGKTRGSGGFWTNFAIGAGTGGTAAGLVSHGNPTTTALGAIGTGLTAGVAASPSLTLPALSAGLRAEQGLANSSIAQGADYLSQIASQAPADAAQAFIKQGAIEGAHALGTPTEIPQQEQDTNPFGD